jgi:hypothetical protein
MFADRYGQTEVPRGELLWEVRWKSAAYWRVGGQLRAVADKRSGVISLCTVSPSNGKHYLLLRRSG